MKPFKILFIFALLLVFNACDKDILNRLPLDEVNDQAFWSSKQDLELYAIQFYAKLPKFNSYDIGAHRDSHTDNVYCQDDFSPILRGVRTVPASGGGRRAP